MRYVEYTAHATTDREQSKAICFSSSLSARGQRVAATEYAPNSVNRTPRGKINIEGSPGSV